MGEISRGSGISSIRGGDFELGASGISAVASSDIVVEDITPLALMPLENDLNLVLGTGTAILTRSTTGRFVDKDDRLIKTAAIDDARFETNGILFEGASTNTLLQSGNTANWNFSEGTFNSSGNNPEGVNGNNLYIANTTTNQHNIHNTNAGISVTIGEKITASINIKGNPSAVHNQIRFRFFDNIGFVGDTFIDNQTFLRFSGGVLPITTRVLANGYTRLSVQFTVTRTNPALGVQLMEASNGSINIAGDGINGNEYHGPRLEQLPFASSDIPTVATTVTRAADNLSIDTANIPAPTVDYTISMELDILGLDSTKTQTVYSVDGETSRKSEINTTTGLLEATHGAVTSTSTTALIAGTKVKIAFAVGGTNQTLYINGVQEDQDVKGTVTGTATAISIGNAAGINQLFGHEQKLRIDEVELSAEQVAAL